jgi:putative copper export protein
LTDLEIVKAIHLIAAAVWTGGLLVLAFSVTAIRSATDDTEVLRSVARMFARVSWIAMGVAVVSGVWLYLFWNLQVSDLSVKWALIGLSIALALGHQLTAKRTPPAIRGIMQLIIIVLAIGIFVAAVQLPV